MITNVLLAKPSFKSGCCCFKDHGSTTAEDKKGMFLLLIHLVMFFECEFTFFLTTHKELIRLKCFMDQSHLFDRTLSINFFQKIPKSTGKMVEFCHNKMLKVIFVLYKK